MVVLLEEAQEVDAELVAHAPLVEALPLAEVLPLEGRDALVVGDLGLGAEVP